MGGERKGKKEGRKEKERKERKEGPEKKTLLKIHIVILHLCKIICMCLGILYVFNKFLKLLILFCLYPI